MAIFAFRKQEVNTGESGSALRTLAVALSLLGGVVGIGSQALADTNGGTSPVPINFTNGAITPFTVPTSNAPWYAYIYNEYVLLTVGLTGNNWAVTSPNTDVTGRISIGTFQGNLRTLLDNNQPLLGGLDLSASNSVFGEVQWPYGFGDGLTTTTNGASQNFQNYPSYLRAFVDGTTQVNVGFDTAQYRLAPTFRRTDGVAGSASDRPLLIASYNIGTNLYIEQRIRLLRTMARFEWTIVNADTQAHTVGLRWTSNLRASDNFYFVNQERGVSPRPVVMGTDPSTPGVVVPPIPDTLDMFSRRADTGTDPGFFNRQIFRGLDATLPLTVYLANARELAPGTATPAGAYLPQAQGIRVPTFETGVASAVYYGNTPQGYTIPAGGRQVVVTYMGEGGTSDLVGDDLVLSTESPTALLTTPGAATLAGVSGNTSATLTDVAPKFIGTPVVTNGVVTGVNNRFQIYASVYSQKQRLPDADVPLTGVQASLTLPPGLRFATDPATGALDTSTKLVTPVGSAAGAAGQLIGDQDGVASWWVEPTGEVYGPVTYQVAVGIAKPNPLSRSIARTITIPATPLVELTSGTFQMVGFPFQLDPTLSNNGDPDTVLNSLSRPIDEPVLLWRWIPDPLSDTGGGRYVKEDHIEPGVSYFYRPAQGSGGKRLIFAKGVAPESLQAPTGNTLPVPLQRILEKGWNMIANPYLYEIPLNYLRIVPLDGNPSLSSMSFSEAVRNNIIKGGVFYFSPSEGGYRFFEDLTAPLKPWQGYWLFVNSRVSVLFATPTQRDAVILPDPVAGVEPATRATTGMTADNWTLDLVARRNDGPQDAATRIGMSTSAASSRTDMPKPPAPFENYVHLSITKGTASSRYAQVLKSPGSKATWELALDSDKDGNVSLLWPGLQGVPKRMRLSITDQQTGQTTSLRGASSVRVNVRKGVTSRFVVTAQADATRPLAITRLTSVGGATRGGASYAYALGLTQDATITASVKTMNGNTVSLLTAGRRASASSDNKLSWNGRNQNGAAVPAGSYVLEVTATNDSGDRVVRTLPIVTVR